MLKLMALLPFLLALTCNGRMERSLFKAECTGMFGRILLIQDSRSQLASEMNRASSQRKQGIIDKEPYMIQADAWLQREASLRARVTVLYDKAYANGCFAEGA